MRHGGPDLDRACALDAGRGEQQIPRAHQSVEDAVQGGGGGAGAHAGTRRRQEGQDPVAPAPEPRATPAA
jgi:hypothetical protein